MSPRYFFSAIALLTLAAVAHARPRVDADPRAAAAAATPEPTPALPPPPPYELKNKSVFTISSTNPRPPFWPIGWVHREGAVIVREAPTSTAIDEHFFRLTSILIGNGTTQSLAVINSRSYSEGEFVRMPHAPGTPPIRVKVLRINDGSVTLERAGQTMQIPLRREELTIRHGDEKLLDEQDREDADPAPAPAPAGKGAPVGQPGGQPAAGTAPRTARH
jgi:hypothetical protein